MVAKPRSITAPHGATWFEIEWEDGFQAKLPNRVLRGYCPCARCQGHGAEVRFQESNAELRDIEEVGRYALRFTWGDGHSEGIYSFEYLRRLAELQQQHGEELVTTFPVLPRNL